jgi:K+-sensing histidine kinase KdpD
VTALGIAIGDHITIADEAMLYVIAILFASLGGRGASIAASVASVAAFDFFFVPPRYTFAVSDTRSIITFSVLLVVGITSGGLIARLRAAETASRERERRTATLLAFTRDAAAATDLAGVRAAVARHGGHDDPRFDEAIANQAKLAIDRLELAEVAREAALRAKAEELRNALLSSVSHDLRTPLAAITGMATTLRERTTDSVELDTIIGEASRLSALLTNLLAITKVESGAAPRRDWVPIEEILGPVLVRLDKELASHPVTTNIAETSLAHVDPILFEQLLLNLLDNAAKHTPPTTPIDVIGRRDGAAAIVEIADRGPGLAPDQRAKVFDKFYRGRTTAPGAGLGLAVCRGIALAHGGTVDVSARDGGGTVFTVRIPDGEPMPVVEEAEAS